ncbi:hypothetical protein ABC974_21780 [Sphingomonas oligophenolica]|uniref:Uncharacterized protein n=1 Tax=Sphingomonas oligophenolica TaxID=301154 RepID=A0ABU9Y903_9SPHN
MVSHVSVLLMKSRPLKADLAAMLNRASLEGALAFAVMAAAFRCSADRLRCYRITAKTRLKRLIEQRNISNKTSEKAPEKISFAVLSLFRPDNSVKSGSVRSLDPSTASGHGDRRHEEVIRAEAQRRRESVGAETPRAEGAASPSATKGREGPPSGKPLSASAPPRENQKEGDFTRRREGAKSVCTGGTVSRSSRPHHALRDEMERAFPSRATSSRLRAFA